MIVAGHPAPEEEGGSSYGNDRRQETSEFIKEAWS